VANVPFKNILVKEFDHHRHHNKSLANRTQIQHWFGCASCFPQSQCFLQLFLALIKQSKSFATFCSLSKHFCLDHCVCQAQLKTRLHHCQGFVPNSPWQWSNFYSLKSFEAFWAEILIVGTEFLLSGRRHADNKIGFKAVPTFWKHFLH